MSRKITKSILSRDEISLLLYSEEPKNIELYGNLFEILQQIKQLKAISIEQLDNLGLNNNAKAALTINKKSLMDNVKLEWYVEADSSEDTSKMSRCGLCNTPNKYLFFIRNRENNVQLNVGSSCMKKFPGIEGYTEYKQRMNRSIKTHKMVSRRNEFHKHFPNVTYILDSSNYYFDNLPILLPFELYYPLQHIVQNLNKIYNGYINQGISKFNEMGVFESFEHNLSQFNEIKMQSEHFIQTNIKHKFICKRDEIDWLIETKQNNLLEQVAKNNGHYSEESASLITYYKFIQRFFDRFVMCSSTLPITFINIKDQYGKLKYIINHSGCNFYYEINIKKFMKNIGCKCIFSQTYEIPIDDLYKVSKIEISSINLQNILDIISDKMRKFGLYILIDDDTDNIYIYKKSEKSIKQYTIKKFIDTYNVNAIQKSMEIYRFISLIYAKNWIDKDEQDKYGLSDKINRLYYQQYVEPYK